MPQSPGCHQSRSYCLFTSRVLEVGVWRPVQFRVRSGLSFIPLQGSVFFSLHLLLVSLSWRPGLPLTQKSRRWCPQHPSPSSPHPPTAYGWDSASMLSWDRPLRAGQTHSLGERERKGRSRRRWRKGAGRRWYDLAVSSGSAHPWCHTNTKTQQHQWRLRTGSPSDEEMETSVTQQDLTVQTADYSLRQHYTQTTLNYI